MHGVEKVWVQTILLVFFRLCSCITLSKGKVMSKWAKISLHNVTEVQLSMQQAICLTITHTSSMNVSTLHDSAAFNKSPVYWVTPKGTTQSMEKKNDDGLDYLTVEHNQITFCFAHLDVYYGSILYAVEKKRDSPWD